MSMSRKDFEMFAEAFGQMRMDNRSRFGAKVTVEAFCDVCEQINPRFDRERFWKRVMHHHRREEE